MSDAHAIIHALLFAAAGSLAAWPLASARQSTAESPPNHGYSRPAPGLSPGQRERFEQGRRLFEQHWVVAPSAFGQWGRGPLSNAEACTDCHLHNGRGRPPLDAGEPLRSAVVRLSVGPAQAPLPHPDYGSQLQHQGVLGKVAGEGEAYLDWVEHDVGFADGVVVTLRVPRLRFEALTLGAIDANTMLSMRVAPPLVALGQFESVPLTALQEIAQHQPAEMRGRIHRLGDMAGRFGQKAVQPSLRAQVAAALHSDLGVTSSHFPAQDCTSRERTCLAFRVTGYPEISDAQLDLIEDYLRGLASPERRNADDPEVKRGERLFVQMQCTVCHVPSLPSQEAGAGGIVRAYSDLLLHDLGPGLADGRPEGQAGASEWRTAPLWGLGLARAVNGNAFLLHDGRARSLDEAILWHGGQAQEPREAFRRLPAADRRALAAFLESL